MKVFKLNNDLTIACVKASSFPDGIEGAFKRLEEIYSSLDGKTLLGISKPENSIIVYRAGVLVQDDEFQVRSELEKFVVHSGTYLKETILNWKDNMNQISDVFEKLLMDNRLDPNSYCIEWYNGDSVDCMVKLID